MSRPIVSPGRGKPTVHLEWARRRATIIVAGALAIGSAALGLWYQGYLGTTRGAHDKSRSDLEREKREATTPAHTADADGAVKLGPDQQKAVGLRLEKVATGEAFDVLSAPGRVAPNEMKYAFITPRAAGVVRTVVAHVGQDVKAGDLLATIDSQEVGAARLDLYTKLQALEIARAQATWQEKIHASTLELLERLRKRETPEVIHEALADRAVGDNRERLMTAYAQYRLAIAKMARNRELSAQKLITTKQFEQVTAEYEMAQSAYQSLMDQTGYESRLANTRAQQALTQAEASVRAAEELLRILGVKPDGTEPEVEKGRVVGVERDGTIAVPGGSEGATPSVDLRRILPRDLSKAVDPVGAHPNAPPTARNTPVSTYSMWAPFDGTILDREMIVPGVAVDTTHRIFTMADLATVWVEASVHESDFKLLARSRGGAVRFRSPAYPDHVFEGRVIYSGDLVEEKSRTVKLLAEAKNPERLLKPGMFVEVEVHSTRDTPAARVASSALLTQGDRTFVFVRTGPDEFAPREVVADAPHGDTAAVRSGLVPGDEVVVEGGSKLKALAAKAVDTGS